MTESINEEKLRKFLEKCDCPDLPPEDFVQSLTHRSHAYEAGLDCDNERLEFLGDAIISAVTSEVLFNADPCANEGALSKRRSQLISRAILGKRAMEMGIGDIMLLGRGERETGGARRRSILGSALEAIVGIIYIRLGYDRSRGFILDHIITPLVDGHGSETMIAEDYKSALQEWTQSRYHTIPAYTLVSEQGPDHDKRFTVRVEFNGRTLAHGIGRRIKAAENDAARQALDLLAGDPGFSAESGE